MDPEDDRARVFFEQGGEFADSGRLKEAEQSFLRALELEPGFVEAQTALQAVRVRLEAGELESPSQSGGSVDWWGQYAAGADESIDEPPPLAQELFLTYEGGSGSVDSSASGASESGGSTISENASGNPNQDPFTWSQGEFSAREERAQGQRTLLSPNHAERTFSASPGRIESPESPVVDRADEPGADVKIDACATPAESLLVPGSDESSFGPTDTSSTGNSTDTVSSSENPEDGDDDVSEVLQLAIRRYQAGDFQGSMTLIEKVLEKAPNRRDARAYRDENQRQLIQIYRARLGDLAKRPRIKLRQQEFVWQSLNHEDGFILSQVDGRTSYEDILEIASMPELDVMCILARLTELGIIG